MAVIGSGSRTGCLGIAVVTLESVTPYSAADVGGFGGPNVSRFWPIAGRRSPLRLKSFLQLALIALLSQRMSHSLLLMHFHDIVL
jgi:hypothetical protein